MRRFCAVALCLLSVVVPAFAADVASAYTVGSWADTATYTAIKDVVAAASQPVTDAATVHSSFMGMFASEGTPPVTDDKGYLWVPASLGDTKDIQYNETKKTGFCRIADNHFLYDFSEAYSGAHDLPMNINGTFMKFIAPSTGTYKWCVTGYFKGSHSLNFAGGQYSIKESGEDTTLFSNSFALSAGTEQVASRGIFVAMGLGDNTFKSILLDGKVFGVKVDSPSGSSFSGFGGGTTRGGGAGRRYNLVSKTKADTAAGGTAAAGSALTDADVLKDFALFDEGSKIVSIPKDDGTTTTYTANTWVYNYETRTYNITTTSDTIVNITYGDDKATVTDGSNPPADYYYAASTGSGGDSGGNSGGGFWDKLLGGLADGILGFFKAIGTVLVSIITGLINLLTDLVGAIGTLIGLVGQVGLILGSFYTFLPPEVQAAVSAALIVVITFSVISVLRK